MNLGKKLKTGCAALLLNCRDASRAQSEALDHALPRATRIGLGLHLLICKWCRRYGQQIRFLRRTACEHHEELTEAASQQLSPEARKRIKRRLQEEN
jgi:hypothetical protein